MFVFSRFGSRFLRISRYLMFRNGQRIAQDVAIASQRCLSRFRRSSRSKSCNIFQSFTFVFFFALCLCALEIFFHHNKFVVCGFRESEGHRAECKRMEQTWKHKLLYRAAFLAFLLVSDRSSANPSDRC